MPKKRKDGRYAKQITIGVQPNGKPKKKTIYGKTIKELEKNERDFYNLLDKGITAAPDNMSVDQLIEIYKKYKKGSSTVSSETYRTIERDMKKISKTLGHMKAKDVKLFHLELFVEDLLDTISPKSASIVVQRVREMFRYALQKDIVYRNPAEFIKSPKFEASNKRMLTDSEKLIIEKADLNDKERFFVSMLRYTGMRRGELLALNRTDIDLSAKTINVCKNLSEGRGRPIINDHTKTSAGMRSIPILDPLYPILELYCKSRIGTLMTTTTGKFIDSSSMYEMWKRILNKMTLANEGKELASDITPHIFRHTFASDLYDAGIDLKRAQYILGHKSIRTTLEIYTHFDKSKLKADEMNEYYRQSKDSQKAKQNA